MKLHEIENDELILSEGFLSGLWKITKAAFIAVGTILLTRAILGYFSKKIDDDGDEEEQKDQYVAYIGVGLRMEDDEKIPSKDLKIGGNYGESVAMELLKKSKAVSAHHQTETFDGGKEIRIYVALVFNSKREAQQLKRLVKQLNKKVDLEWKFLAVKKKGR